MSLLRFPWQETTTSANLKPYFDNGAGLVIYHGDCREVMPLLQKHSLVLTDPPYKMKHVDGGGFLGAREFYADGALDGLCEFDLSIYSDLLSKAADQLVAFHSRDSILEYGGFIIKEFGNYDLHLWHKVNAPPFVANTWKSDVEYIALGWRAKKHAKVEQAIKSKLYQSGIETGNLHPTQKPLALMKKYLRVLSPETTLDPFMGSGTTLLAAKELNLSCTGIEKEERYCERAARRLQQAVFEF